MVGFFGDWIVMMEWGGLKLWKDWLFWNVRMTVLFWALWLS